MEPIRRRPQDLTPGRPLPGRSSVPAGHRPVFNDFAIRPQARPIANTTARPPVTSVPGAPQLPPKLTSQPAHAQRSLQPHTLAPTTQPNPTPVQPAFPASSSPNVQQPAQAAASTPQHTPASPTPQSTMPPQPDTSTTSFSEQQHPTRPYASNLKTPDHKNHTKRAGLVGFICFVLLTGLLLSPFVPGKTFDSFPGSSQSSSTGDDSLACIGELGQVTTALTYDHRLGSPITYSYATTSTQKATCGNKLETAVAGHAGQFNPLGLLIDITLALIVAVAVAKIWRKVFHEQD
ncbi:MAG TPA: hypothetical protein VLG92_02525 [Candidatus Saccharimonadia bacterium]|nr:hypothetical protein [Candidatus Saccharimonadia bacterium]